MEDTLASHFDRVEQALSTLVDSIAAYNPSPQAAIDLVAADDQLSQGLDQLARHQANHARIQSLHAEMEALEDQLKSSVATLASLRHELFDTPATTFPEESRPVHVDELLRYAKNISKHTVPPTYRERAPAAVTDKDKDKDETASSGAPTNGVNTPAIAPDSMDTTRDAPGAPQDSQNPDSVPVEITAAEEEWLKKLKDSKIAWYPWPSDDKVRSGNLYKLMYWQAKNKDLDHFNIHAHEEAEKAADLPVAEIAEEAPTEAQTHDPQVQQPAIVPRPPQIPKQDKRTFDAFDDLDDE